MNRQSMVNGLLALTVVSVMTGCVDDKYDLTDIDTTSRFTVDDLTVPVNLSSIKLQNVVNLDDNDLIEKVIIDGKECYSIVKGGVIEDTKFDIKGIHVDEPTFQPSNFSINDVPGGGVYVPGQYDVQALDLPHIDLQDYNFKMDNVDKALEVLNNVKTQNDIDIRVDLTILSSELTGNNANIAFEDLMIQLPWGLITNAEGYDEQSGMLTINSLPVVDGKATLIINASGLELGDKGTINDSNPDNRILDIKGNVGIASGKIKMTVSNLTLPSKIDIRADYSVSSFDIRSFSGKVNYNMDNIDIAPIELNDLPDFLDSPQTNLIIANPQILVNITNPVGDKLVGKGKIILTSKFKNGTEKVSESDVFELVGNDTELAFCTPKEGAQTVEFEGLRDVLSNGNAGLPSSIKVEIKDINFAGEVTDFLLGDLGNAGGSYEFNAPLGFGDGSRVIYESTEGDWGSDDLDKVSVNKIHLSAKCSTDLPVSIELTIYPVDRDGNVIPVKEGSLNVPAMAKDYPLNLNIEGVNGPIQKFNGVKFVATIEQNDGKTEAIGPELQIELKDLRVTVDGYYETDF